MGLASFSPSYVERAAPLMLIRLMRALAKAEKRGNKDVNTDLFPCRPPRLDVSTVRADGEDER